MHQSRWVLAITLGAVVTAGMVLVGYRIPLSSDRLRREVIATLADRLQARVELDTLEFRPFPRVNVSGGGLVIYHRRHPDVALIRVERFTVAGDLLGLLRKHAAHVTLLGLAIQIPPGDQSKPRPPLSRPGPARPEGGRQFVIDRLRADGASLTLIPRDPAKHPKVWRLHELRLESVGLGQVMPFRSVLTNAVPPGAIHTTGTFGPWRADDPGATPVSGAFTFDGADLSVFKGIAGILSATGTFDGTLDRIDALGQTRTPDFTVSASGQPIHLDADYHAIIDGTNGDTTLQRIEARFMETRLVATGSVYDVPEADRGRNVTLDVVIEKGRLEDVLRLAVPTPTPTMTGALTLSTRFVLPAEDRSVIDKLELDGSFSIDDGRFTDPGVQGKVNTLSGKARDDEEEGRPVRSDFNGRFRLAGGRLTLNPLRFTVPGALVDVSGTYTLRSERLAFEGQLLMDARVSQAVDGWKSLLLKPFDPLFRRNGRTFIPLQIGGTRNHPSFGVDVKRIFNKNAPARPRQPEPRRPATAR